MNVFLLILFGFLVGVCLVWALIIFLSRKVIWYCSECRRYHDVNKYYRADEVKDYAGYQICKKCSESIFGRP